MKTTAIIILLLCMVRPVSAQYALDFPKWYPETKLNHLYVLTEDSTTEYAKEMVSLIKKYWTLTPVSVLYGRAINVPDPLLVKGNLFLSAGMASSNYAANRGDGHFGATSYNDYFHLDLWSMRDVYNPGKGVSESIFTLGSAELHNRLISTGDIANKSKFDFTSALFPGDYTNGMMGNIKNMIQYFNENIPAGNSRKLLKDASPSAEISVLKNETLYVPNLWYGAPGTMLEEFGPGSNPYKRAIKYIDEMLASYPYKVKLISREELNKMILSADKNFYYLNYIQSSADKIISVVNGYNGNLVYSEVIRKSYKPKEKDLEKLGKAIQ